MAVTMEAVISAFVLTLTLAIASLLFFSILRNLSSTRRFYSPKRFDVKQETKPRRLPSGYILWVWQLLWIPDDEIITVAGLDSAVQLRVMRMSWYMMLYIMVWCMAVVLPVNLSGGEVEAMLAARVTAPPPPAFSPITSLNASPPVEPPSNPYAPGLPLAPSLPPAAPCFTVVSSPVLYETANFDVTGMTNIPFGSHKLWAHIVSVYVVTTIVLKLLWKYNHEMTVLRILFLANAPKGGHSHTVLVQDIPGIQYGTIPWRVRQVLDGTVFRVLPASWRDWLVQVAEDVVYRGVETVYLRARQAASKATRLGAVGGGRAGEAQVAPNDVASQASASGSVDAFSKFSYSQHARQFDPPPAQHANGVYGALRRTASEGAPPHTPPHTPAPAPPPRGGDVELTDPGGPTQAPGPSAAGTSAPFQRIGRPGPDPWLRSYAARFNVDVEPPPRAKVDLANIKSRGLDVWAIAEDYLTKPPKLGKPPHTFQSMIADEFGYVYGKSAVAAVNPVWDQRKVDPLISEFKTIRTALEDYLDWVAVCMRRRKMPSKVKRIRIVPMVYGSWGQKTYGVKPVKVDAIDFWTARLRHLEGAIAEAQQQARGFSFTPAAFVTFNSRVSQVIAAGSLHQHIESMWRVLPAPEPGEVLWQNVGMRTWERALRYLAHWGLYFVLQAFYMLPVTAVQGLINVPALTDTQPVHELVSAIMQSIMPGLILKIFIQLLPYIFATMCRHTGFVSLSAVDFGVVKRFFTFQVLVLFVGSLISGTFLNQIEAVLKNPSAMVRTMATSVPQAAPFFLNYVLVAGLASYAVTFLRPVQLVVFFVHSRLVSTPRQRARLWAEIYTKYGRILPQNLIIFLFGVVFCIVNPIMTLATFAYFSFVCVYERYNHLYVFRRKYESGGRVWPVVFHQMMVALYFMQFILLLIISLKGFPMSTLIIPVIIYTIGFHIVCTQAFTRPWTVMSLHDASFLDYKDRKSRADGGKALTETEKAAIQEMYLSPAFKHTGLMEIDELLLEAEKIKRLIAGEGMQSILQDWADRGLVGSELGEAAAKVVITAQAAFDGGTSGDDSGQRPAAAGPSRSASAAAAVAGPPGTCGAAGGRETSGDGRGGGSSDSSDGAIAVSGGVPQGPRRRVRFRDVDLRGGETRAGAGAGAGGSSEEGTAAGGQRGTGGRGAEGCSTSTGSATDVDGGNTAIDADSVATGAATGATGRTAQASSGVGDGGHTKAGGRAGGLGKWRRAGAVSLRAAVASALHLNDSAIHPQPRSGTRGSGGVETHGESTQPEVGVALDSEPVSEPALEPVPYVGHTANGHHLPETSSFVSAASWNSQMTSPRLGMNTKSATAAGSVPSGAGGDEGDVNNETEGGQAAGGR